VIHPSPGGKLRDEQGAFLRSDTGAAYRLGRADVVRWTGWSQTSYKVGRIHPQSGGYLQEIVQAQVAGPPFNLSEEGPVNVAAMGGGFLAEVKQMSPPADSFAEGGCG
jgi:hypothetical protein